MNEEIEHLIRTLTDDADELHADMTPAVDALARIGLPAAPALLDVLLEPDGYRRLVAQRALERIVMRGCEDVDAFLDLWKANGNYAYDADPGARAASVVLWRGWLAGQEPRP